MPKKKVRIYKSKAAIFQNDYAVWQFRIWLADEDKYFRQSSRTKDCLTSAPMGPNRVIW